MEWNPNRVSGRWWGNVGCSSPGDPFGRNFEYVRDPVDELEKQFRLALGWPVFVISMVQGNPTIWTEMPDGTLQGSGQEKYSASLASVEPKAMDALLRGINARGRLGLKTWIYTGKFLSSDGLIVDRNTTPRVGDNQASFEYLRHWYGRLIDASVSRLIFDNMADGDQIRMVELAKKSLGMTFGGEALALRDAGPGNGPGGRRYEVNKVPSQACPWICEDSFLVAWDPDDHIRVDPTKTEFRVRIWDGRYPDPKDSIAMALRVRRMGGVVDWLYDVRSEVLAALGRGD